MRLRIRHANGIATLNNVSNEQTVAELKQQILQTLQLSSTYGIQISGGYPPKPITDDTLVIQNSGLRDGDTLNVKITENTVQQVETTSSESSFKLVKEGVVQTPNGFLTLRTMEDDNSCLFRSIGYVLSRDTSIANELRHESKLIPSHILMSCWVKKENPSLLEKYIQWIQKPTSWGGAIELSIFSSFFNVEIDSIDVQTGRIDKFGKLLYSIYCTATYSFSGEGSYDERVLIVYSGIHYDALALSPASDSPPEFDQTRFPVTDSYILDAAKEITESLRRGHKYTDVANFTLRCEQCKTGLKGEKDAHNHAAVRH
ncbi:ubiquitin-specific protease otu1 [Rhizopus azygosporus]|uniref:Ubiquitin thioesterase OTU n=1 Tax=Rhizopus azygosporus TaxID=86630 RepID=A0A367J0Q6_RHIAZ|nr:ubiquitin-specific protease otu1 [Rhizopus azygosporus]